MAEYLIYLPSVEAEKTTNKKYLGLACYQDVIYWLGLDSMTKCYNFVLLEI